MKGAQGARLENYAGRTVALRTRYRYLPSMKNQASTAAPPIDATLAPGEFAKYPHLERLGKSTSDCECLYGDVYVFPKIDGTNASVWWHPEHAVQCGSRNRVLSAEADNAGFHAWLYSDGRAAEQLRSFIEAHTGWTVYGEWLVPHTFKGYRADAWRQFYVFDVLDRGARRFVPYSQYEKEILAEELS